jgi:hypothetical protein
MVGIILNDMQDSKFSVKLKPCTPELALSVGQNLRWEDRREVEETTGLTAEAAVIESYYKSAYDQCWYIENPDGKAAGVAGISPGNIIWLLCTEASTEYPHAFVKAGIRLINSLPNPYLYNHADMRNESHIKLLKLAGFKFIRYHVVNKVPLIEFIKLCANP